ncbi:MAG TPA: D-ribose ABC transporter substrate-binding protein, partial [Chryseolinea sp.]
YQALAAAGKPTVRVFGFDGAEAVIDAIRSGKIEATGMQFPQLIAEHAAIFADEYFKGKRDFATKMPVAVELVTKENVDNYLAYGKKDEAKEQK